MASIDDFNSWRKYGRVRGMLRSMRYVNAGRPFEYGSFVSKRRKSAPIDTVAENINAGVFTSPRRHGTTVGRTIPIKSIFDVETDRWGGQTLHNAFPHDMESTAKDFFYEGETWPDITRAQKLTKSGYIETEVQASLLEQTSRYSAITGKPGVLKDAWETTLGDAVDDAAMAGDPEIAGWQNRWANRRAPFYDAIDPKSYATRQLGNAGWLESQGLDYTRGKMHEIVGGKRLSLKQSAFSKRLALGELGEWAGTGAIGEKYAYAPDTRLMTTGFGVVPEDSLYFGRPSPETGKKLWATPEQQQAIAQQRYGQSIIVKDVRTGEVVPIGSGTLRTILDPKKKALYTKKLKKLRTKPRGFVDILRDAYHKEVDVRRSGFGGKSMGFEYIEDALSESDVRTPVTTVGAGVYETEREIAIRKKLLRISGGSEDILGESWRYPAQKKLIKKYNQRILEIQGEAGLLGEGAGKTVEKMSSGDIEKIRGFRKQIDFLNRISSEDPLYLNPVEDAQRKYLMLGSKKVRLERLTHLGQTSAYLRSGKEPVLLEKILASGLDVSPSNIFPDPMLGRMAPDVVDFHAFRVPYFNPKTGKWTQTATKLFTEEGYDVGWLSRELSKEVGEGVGPGGYVGKMPGRVYSLPEYGSSGQITGFRRAVGLLKTGTEKRLESYDVILKKMRVMGSMQYGSVGVGTGQPIQGVLSGVADEGLFYKAIGGVDPRESIGKRVDEYVGKHYLNFQKTKANTKIMSAISEKNMLSKGRKQGAIAAAAVTAGALLLWGASRSRKQAPVRPDDVPSSMYGAPSMGPQYAGGQPAYQQRARITPNDYRGGYTTNINMETEDQNGMMDYRGIANTMSSASRTALGVNKISTDLHVTDDSRSINSNQIQRQFAEYLNR